MLIIKTSSETMTQVVRQQKHALPRQPRLSPGEIILISEKRKTLAPGKKPIQYLMEFVRCYEDIEKESIKIWGRYWPYIIEGKNCRQLRLPFDICEHQVTKKDYGRGGTIVYVTKEDSKILEDKGLLNTL